MNTELNTELVLIQTTVNQREAAQALAKQLVQTHMAACVNLSPLGESIYHWNGQIESATEITLTIKTSRTKQASCIQAILQAHPYEVPEIIVLPILHAYRPYANWVIQHCGNT